jgi:membrane protease YdiL (CAAX protease family)
VTMTLRKYLSLLNSNSIGTIMNWQELDHESIGLMLSGALIVVAELLIFFGHLSAAATIHAINLIALVLSAAYIQNRAYPILMLLPLFRLSNLAMPVFFHLTIYSFPLIYAPMFLPIYLIIKEKSLSREEMGLTLRGIHYYVPLGIAVGMVLGWGEYSVLHPQILTPDEGIEGFLELSVIMIFFVGLVEEFVFRSALQTVASEKLGKAQGLLVASLLFGFMHGGYHLTSEIIFTFSAGLVFGILFLKTSSLPLIAVAHGVTNISLFLIVPVYSELILPITAISLILGCVFAFRSRDPKLSLRSD